MGENQLSLFGGEDPEQPQSRRDARQPTWNERYSQVIASPRWKRLRDKFIAKADNTCPRCGWKKERWDKSRTLELHHKTYERLGNEWDSDLELVCSRCHSIADIERGIRSRREADRKCRQALTNAQFDGWASKVYGDEYDDSDGDKFERFLEWRERQDE